MISDTHVTFLMGKPAKPGSLTAGLVERMHHHWRTVVLHQPAAGVPLPESISESDIIIQRGLSPELLRMIEPLESSGIRCINRIGSSLDCANRWTLMSKLDSGFVPVPETRLFDRWADLLDFAEGNPIVVKALDGEVGRGSNVLISTDGILPQNEPFAGPYIAQKYLAGNPTVTKVYVAGNEMRGLVKRSLVADEVDESFAASFQVNNELRDLSTRVANTLALDIFGVDFLDGPQGPTVIDVNPFPGFRGIPDAIKFVSEHILDEARERV